MDKIEAFKEIAPFLKEPLVLVGFVIFLLFLIFQLIISLRLLKTTTIKEGEKTSLVTILHYSFFIAIIVILLGFGLAYYKTYWNISTQTKQTQKKNESITTNTDVTVTHGVGAGGDINVKGDIIIVDEKKNSEK